MKLSCFIHIYIFKNWKFNDLFKRLAMTCYPKAMVLWVHISVQIHQKVQFKYVWFIMSKLVLHHIVKTQHTLTHCHRKGFKQHTPGKTVLHSSLPPPSPRSQLLTIWSKFKYIYMCFNITGKNGHMNRITKPFVCFSSLFIMSWRSSYRSTSFFFDSYIAFHNVTVSSIIYLG